MASASPLVIREWVNRPGTDYGVVFGAVALGFAVRSTGVHFLESLDASDRLMWLQTLAGTAVAVFGVAVTATTIFYVVSPGPRLASAMASIGLPLTRLLTSSVAATGVGAVVFLAAMPFYARERVTIVSVVVLATAVFLALRTARLLWLFSRLLRAFVAEDFPPATPLVRDWQAPEVRADDYALPERRPLRRSGRS